MTGHKWWSPLAGRLRRLLHGDAATCGCGTIRLSERPVERIGQKLLQWNEAAHTTAAAFTGEERELAARLRLETDRLNRNNVTRTEAYRRYYMRLPELHWALLAHLVSRNGGWSMTDLQGELLPRLLPRADRENVFQMLERANSLIFYDAYPQLLLYEESLLRSRSLFHLLPLLGVSRFMTWMWDSYWEDRDAGLLTVGLVINEQHYIEDRVVRDPGFRSKVLEQAFFKAQGLLQLNQVVFPYRHATELAGLILEQFDDLDERIRFGLKLYAMLFGCPPILDGVLKFVQSSIHTGSRADYWPSLFASSPGGRGDSGQPNRTGERSGNPAGNAGGSGRKPEKSAETPYRQKLQGGKLMASESPLCSPTLEEAWPDSPVETPVDGDWLSRERAAGLHRYLKPLRAPTSFLIRDAYISGLNKLELAVMANSRLQQAGEVQAGDR